MCRNNCFPARNKREKENIFVIDVTKWNEAKFNYVQEFAVIYQAYKTAPFREGNINEYTKKNRLDGTDRCTSTLLSSIPTIVETFRHISAFPRRRFGLLSLSPTALGILLKIYDVRSVWIRKFLCSRMRYSTEHINTKRSVTSHSTIFERVSVRAAIELDANPICQ